MLNEVMPESPFVSSGAVTDCCVRVVKVTGVAGSAAPAPVVVSPVDSSGAAMETSVRVVMTIGWEEGGSVIVSAEAV